MRNIIIRFYNIDSCLHPDAPQGCDQKIIKAHTLQRTQLNLIARNNKVYVFTAELGSVFGTGKMDERLVATSRASTIKGLCAIHDKQLFQVIEDLPITMSQEQLFLLSYRSLIFNQYMYLGVRAAADWILENFYVEDLDRHVDTIRWMKEHSVTALVREREFFEYKSQYDNVLRKNQFDELRTCILITKEKPEILTAFARIPVYGFDGEHIQRMLDLDTKTDVITCTILATSSGGAVIFTWLGESKANAAFMDSLLNLPKDDIASSIVRFVFECSNNICVAPVWWDNIEEETRKQLRSISLGPGPRNIPFKEYRKKPYTYHTKTDLKPVHWHITKIIRDY